MREMCPAKNNTVHGGDCWGVHVVHPYIEDDDLKMQVPVLVQLSIEPSGASGVLPITTMAVPCSPQGTNEQLR
eukprot:5540095-Amphidinium_carterae.1